MYCIVMGTNYFKSSLTTVVNYFFKVVKLLVNYFPDKVVIN